MPRRTDIRPDLSRSELEERVVLHMHGVAPGEISSLLPLSWPSRITTVREVIPAVARDFAHFENNYISSSLSSFLSGLVSGSSSGSSGSGSGSSSGSSTSEEVKDTTDATNDLSSNVKDAVNLLPGDVKPMLQQIDSLIAGSSSSSLVSQLTSLVKSAGSSSSSSSSSVPIVGDATLTAADDATLATQAAIDHELRSYNFARHHPYRATVLSPARGRR